MAPSKILTSAEVRANAKETTDLVEAFLPKLKYVEEHCAREDYNLNLQGLGPGLDTRDYLREADLRGRAAVTKATKDRLENVLKEMEQVKQRMTVAPPAAEEQERKYREVPKHVVVSALKMLSTKSCLDLIRELDPEVREMLMSPELKRYKELESLEVLPSSQLKERLDGMKDVNDIVELREVMKSMDNELQAAKRQATVFQERLYSADVRSLAMNQEQVLRTQLEEMLAAEKSRNAKGEEGLELRLAHMTQKYQNADMFHTQTVNENKKLTAQLNQHEDTIKSLQKTADDANADVERLKEQTKRAETHDQMVTGLLVQVETEASQLTGLTQELETLKEQEMSQNAALSFLRGQVEEYKAELTSAKAEVVKRDNELADAKVRISSLEQDLEQLKTAKVESEKALKEKHDAEVHRVADELAQAHELQRTQGNDLRELRALVAFGAASLCNVHNKGVQWQSPDRVWPDLLKRVMVAIVPARGDKEGPWTLEVWPEELPSSEDAMRREVPHGWEALALGAALTSEGSTWETILPIVEAATLALASAEELPAQAFLNVMAQAAELLGESDDANDNMGVLALMQATSIAGRRFSVQGVDTIQATLLPWLSNTEFAPLVSLVSSGRPEDVDAFEEQARSDGRLVDGRLALFPDILYVLVVDLRLRRILAVHPENQHCEDFQHRKVLMYKGPGGETVEIDVARLPQDIVSDLWM